MKIRKKLERLGQTRNGVWTPEYRAYTEMIRRCYETGRARYPSYGGRNITVCARWRNSYAAFLLDVGVKPGPKFSLERLNNNKGYTPSNVVWATAEQQQRNTRRTKFLCFRGQRLSLVEWAAVLKLPYGLLKRRLLNGWSMEQAVTTPIDTSKTGRPPRLSIRVVKKIRKQYARGVPWQKIAKAFGVSGAYVRDLGRSREGRKDAF